MATFSRSWWRWLAVGIIAAALVAILAVQVDAQSVNPFAFPVAPPGTPVGFIPVTADTHGNVIWGVAPDAGGIGPGTAGQIFQTNATPAAAWQTVTGDTTISSGGATTTGAIHGATVPAAGALTTGNVLQVSGASALTYSPVNLAGGGNYVTGNLPVANVAPGTNGQVLATHSSASGWSNTIGDTGVSTTITGSVTQSGGAVSLTGNAASQVSTSSGALTLDSAAALNLGTTNATSVVVGNSSNTTAITQNVASGDYVSVAVAGTKAVQFGEVPGSTTYGGVFPEGVTPGSGNYMIAGNSTGNTIVGFNAAANLFFFTGGAEIGVMTGSDFSPNGAGVLTFGSASPWGSTFLGGATNLSFTEFAAATGSHNSQDGPNVNNVVQGQLTGYSAVTFNGYTLTGGSGHGLHFHVGIVGRVVRAGVTGCTFWDTGHHGTVGNIFSCVIEGEAQDASGSWSSYTNPVYEQCDCTAGICSFGVSNPTNPLFSLGTSGSGSNLNLTWALFNDGCTGTTPQVDAIGWGHWVDN